MSLTGTGVSATKGVIRTTPQLYRDCLRLVNHIAGRSKKANNIKKVILTEFRKNAKVNDPVLIDQLKSHAIRGLANYLMMESSSKDPRLQQASSTFSSTSVKQAQNVKEQLKNSDLSINSINKDNYA